MELQKVGFGTMEYGDREGLDYEDIFKQAINCGYRHFDTAEIYQTASCLGKALIASNIDRKEFFITSKLKGLPTGKYEDIKERLLQHLKSLNLNYLDLLLIHAPTDSDVDFFGDPSEISKYSLEWFRVHIKEAWDHLIQLKNEGLANQIGVSNFYRMHIEELLKISPVKPFANEIFIDAVHQEREFVDYLQQHQIRVIAYRPLAFLPNIQMASDFGSSYYQNLLDLSTKLNLNGPDQVILGYLIARGIYVIVKSSQIDHMKNNLETAKLDLGTLIELNITEEDIETIEMAGGLDEYAQSFKNLA